MRRASSSWIALSLSLAVPSAAEEPRGDVEEIVVSITKRDELLSEVAASVSAFSAETIALANLESAADLTALVPNAVTKGESRTGNFSIRGVSDSFSSPSPVAYHVNGVFKPGIDSLLGQYYDLAAIELVRGPSGTVYGRNATAGALDFRWEKPHATYEAKGDALYGNYRHLQLRGVVNAPLLGEGDERLMARLVLQRSERDGYLNDLERRSRRRDPHNADEWYSRLSLRSLPNEDTELTLRGFYNQSDADPYVARPLVDAYTTGFVDTRSIDANGTLLAENFGVVAFDPYHGYEGFVESLVDNLVTSNDINVQVLELLINLFATNSGRPFREVAREVMISGRPPLIPSIVDRFIDPPAQVGVAALPISRDPLRTRSGAWRAHRTQLHVYGLDGSASWTGDALRVDASFGWERGALDQVVDADGSELPVLDIFRPHRNDLRTGELRVSSQSDGALDWLAGVFYFRSTNDRERDEVVLPFGRISSESHGVATGFAPFVNATLRPLEWLSSAPAIDLELFGGWRWNRDSLRLEFENVTHPSGPSGPQSGRAVFTEDTWELGVRWLPSERHTLYLKHAKGYKAGNLEADNQTGVIRSADPELIRAWELGLKSSLADDRVRLALTGFWSDYSDLQVPQVVGLSQFTLNAAAATVRGVELELFAQPTPALQLQASAGFLDARFDEFCSDDAAQALPVSEPGCPAAHPLFPWQGQSNLAGHRLEDAPKWKVSALASYQVDLGAAGTLTPLVKTTFTSDYFLRPYALAADRVDAYTRTDLRLVWRDAEERISVEAFAENLENEIVFARGTTTGEFSGSFPASIGLLPPRTYGARVSFAWRAE